MGEPPVAEPVAAHQTRSLRAGCAVQAALPIGVVALVVGATFHRQLFAGWTFPWDFLGTYTASPPFVAMTAGRGRWTEWVPFVGGGAPLAVDPLSELYFPLWWLLGAANVPLTLSTLTIIQVLHVAVGALGAASLAKARRVPHPWALVAGVAYAFFGGFYAQAEHADMFRGFAYAPWLLWVLTPPAPGRSWKRLLLLPLVAWLIAAGAYPGQLVAFWLMGALYGAMAVAGERGPARRLRLGELAMAGAGSAAVSVAVVLPYLMAVWRDDLVRVNPPDATVLAAHAWHALDWLGLYLNNFAWAPEGGPATIRASGIGIPAVIGLACIGRAAIRRQLPLVTTGVAAGILATLPAWTFAGELMARVPLLFPSRFPASDYKAVAVLALIILATEGWRGLAGMTERRPVTRLAVASGVLVAGVLLVPSTHAAAAPAAWVVVAIVLATAGLAVVRLRSSVLVVVLLLLVVADGTRMTLGYGYPGGNSSWLLPPHEAISARARDPYVRRLDQFLASSPARRPQRVPFSASGPPNSRGSVEDAAGYVGDGYRLDYYGGSVTRARWTAQNDPTLRDLAAAPWMAWSLSRGRWRSDPRIDTTSYGLSAITYRVDLDRSVLMMENELSFPGWSANHGVRRVDAAGPFRTWRLPAGRYRFTASYRQPERPFQLVLAALALVAWGTLGIVVLGYSKLRRSPS